MRNSGPETPVSSTDERRTSAGQRGLERLFETLRPDLLRFAYWLSRDRAIAEDVVQDALLRAWRSRGELRDLAAARAWLLTIVRREHARLHERKRLELTNLDAAIEREDGDLAADGDGKLFDLRVAILKLPDEYREPLVMQVLGGFSTEEIGRELNLSTAAVLTRLFRARNKLRSIYGLVPAPEPRGDEDLP
ncbi:MAG TPA: sigma-70 family RNA polymerase sigma factor [Steroidobacteraceae bacterium]|nr:sigma-70 family RNA polymerase sigma factor [Steroidobacteraceae bacterium]